MKYFAWLAQALLSVAVLTMAYLQLNDPDPLFWTTLYFAIALVPVAQLMRFDIGRGLYIVMGIALAGLLISLPGFIDFVLEGDFAAIDDSMRADRPQIEFAREFLGVCIGLACLGGSLWLSRRLIHPTSEVSNGN